MSIRRIITTHYVALGRLLKAQLNSWLLLGSVVCVVPVLGMVTVIRGQIEILLGRRLILVLLLVLHR